MLPVSNWDGEGAVLMTIQSTQSCIIIRWKFWNIYSHGLYDPSGFVFEEPQLPSDGGIPCSTCCSHLALMIVVSCSYCTYQYRPPNCECRHYGTNSLKQNPRCATHVGVVYFSSLHHVRHGCSWPFYALFSRWKVVGLDCLSYASRVTWFCVMITKIDVNVPHSFHDIDSKL